MRLDSAEAARIAGKAGAEGERDEIDFIDPAHFAAEHGTGGRRGTVCARRLCGGQARHRVLGPLGPGANDVLAKLCREWADQEKVEVKIDFITSQGDKLMLTGAAEEQARSGHDILGIPTWYAAPRPSAWCRSMI
jgi:hypothetical protein